MNTLALTSTILIISTVVNCNVIDLSGYEVDEFKSEVENHDGIFIKFFAPYCVHCKSMAKDFLKTARKISDEVPVALAEVDCTSATGTLICKEYGVSGYPSLKLFKNGVPFKDFDGNRTFQDMTKWLKKHAAQHSKRVSSFTELDKIIETADEPLLLAVLENYQDGLIERWERAAKKVNDHWQFRDVKVSLSSLTEQKTLCMR